MSIWLVLVKTVSKKFTAIPCSLFLSFKLELLIFGFGLDVAGLKLLFSCWSLIMGAADILGLALFIGRELLVCTSLGFFPSYDDDSLLLLVSSLQLEASTLPALETLLLLCTLWSDGYISKLLLSFCRNSDFLREVGLWFKYWFNIGGSLVTGSASVFPVVGRRQIFFSTNVRFLYKKYIFFFRCSAVTVSWLSSNEFLHNAESLFVPKNPHFSIL